MTTQVRTADFRVSNEGSIVLVQPLTQAAVEWIAEHVQGDAQWFGTALVVEHRYADNLITGMQSDGLVGEVE